MKFVDLTVFLDNDKTYTYPEAELMGVNSIGFLQITHEGGHASFALGAVTHYTYSDVIDETTETIDADNVVRFQ